jgi:transposase-like protein
MKEEEKNVYQKRTQKDYSMSFKLQIVQSIERGELTAYDARKQYGIQGDSTVLKWLRKFGNFDWQTQIPSKMAKTPAQRLMELEQEVLLLKKQKALLEKQIEFSDKKAIIFDIMIDDRFS